jgi:hypothetical protein
MFLGNHFLLGGSVKQKIAGPSNQKISSRVKLLWQVFDRGQQ